MAASKKNEVFINPAGFIEQHYIGDQTEKSTSDGISQLEKLAGQLRTKRQPILILIDITKLGGTTAGARMAGIKGMKSVKYRRAAMYGSLSTQMLVNTLALIAGKQDNTKAFKDRAEAIKWLKG